MQRIKLPNGCSCSKPAVNPKNWEQPGASVKKDWSIRYRFYDPMITEGKYKNGKQVPVKGMNQYKTLAERRAATKALLEHELDLLKNKGFNPITKTFCKPVADEYEVSKTTPFIAALEQAAKKMDKADSTMSDIRSVIKGTQRAAIHLRLNLLPIVDIETKHINSILLRCGEIMPAWSNNRHNKYRAYLLMMFKTLAQFGAVKANPVREIATKKTIKKIRPVLTEIQRRTIDTKLRESNYEFWRLLHVFFHSGSRETELMRVQGKDVDLVGQRVKYLVKKGNTYREVWRTIKDIALPLWEELMKDCSDNDYVFSVGLRPGPKSIRADQLTRRWKRHVKDKMNVTADFYCLKHMHTADVVRVLSSTSEQKAIEAAAKHNQHTPAMVVQIYDTTKEERDQDRIKTMTNAF